MILASGLGIRLSEETYYKPNPIVEIGDIDISKVIESHKNSGKIATLTAVNPPGKFGNLIIDADGAVRKFDEKPDRCNSCIKGSFFVQEIEVFKYINDDEMPWKSWDA